MRACDWLGRLAAGGALLAAALSVSGCGAQQSVDPVAKAAEVTAELPGEHIVFSERLSSPLLAGQIAVSGTGYINQSQYSGELTMKFPQVPGAPSSLSNADIQMVFQYPDFYMKFPSSFGGKLTAGKPWVKIDMQRAASQAFGADLSGLSSAGETDPTQYLNFLRGASGGVTDLGEATIEGVKTTHYRATIQFDRILARLPASERAGAEAGLHQLQKLGGINSMPVEVWIDGSRRVRREQIGIHEQVNGTPVDGTVTVNYTSFGPVPAVAKPPPSQVYDLTSLAASGMKRAAGG